MGAYPTSAQAVEAQRMRMGERYWLGVQSRQAHLRMTYYLILTESGSQYELDTEKKTFKRTRSEAGSFLDFDGKEITYDEMLAELTIDTPFRALWKDGERWRVRTTTPMVMIERG